MEIYVGRQPILDLNDKVYAYELLYRADAQATRCEVDAAHAASTVVANTLLDLGIENVTHNKRAFLNCTESFLLQHDYQLLPSESVVIEVLEDVPGSPEVVHVLREAKEEGYMIALDDVILGKECKPLLECADIVKVDFMEQSMEDVAKLVEVLKPYGVKLLAEKVESRDQIDQARAMGFEYFQGFYFAKPNTVAKKSIPASKQQAMQLMRELSKDQVDVSQLEKLISHDAAMSYKLLRFVNSATHGLRTEVTSLRHAVTTMGLREIRRWMRVFSMASLSSGKPTELLLMSLARGRFCELMAEAGGSIEPSVAFSVGMFSLMDALLDRPMQEIISELSLNPDMASALLEEFGGPLGHLLPLVRAVEKGDWAAMENRAASASLPVSWVTTNYVDAIKYAQEFYDSVVD